MPDKRNPRTDESPDRTSRDRELGLFRPITRRDLLHGVGVADVGSMATPFAALAKEEEVYAPERASGYYPPSRTGRSRSSYRSNPLACTREVTPHYVEKGLHDA